MIDFKKIKRFEDDAKSRANAYSSKLKMQEKLRAMNSEFTVCQYNPQDELNIIERKILNRIDIELAHKDPSSKINISVDSYGKYSMDYSAGNTKINKTCEDKEKCFENLKNFILTIRNISV